MSWGKKFTFPTSLFRFFVQLIHSADPQSRPVVIIVFTHVVRPSVPTFQNLAKHKVQAKIVIATVGLAEWIIADTHVLSLLNWAGAILNYCWILLKCSFCNDLLQFSFNWERKYSVIIFYWFKFWHETLFLNRRAIFFHFLILKLW